MLGHSPTASSFLFSHSCAAKACQHRKPTLGQLQLQLQRIFQMPEVSPGASAAVHGDAHGSVSIDPANYSAKTRAPGEHISYQLACKVLPSTSTHGSPARAPVLLTCAAPTNSSSTRHTVTSPRSSQHVRDVTQSSRAAARALNQSLD